MAPRRRQRNDVTRQARSPVYTGSLSLLPIFHKVVIQFIERERDRAGPAKCDDRFLGRIEVFKIIGRTLKQLGKCVRPVEDKWDSADQGKLSEP